MIVLPLSENNCGRKRICSDELKEMASSVRKGTFNHDGRQRRSIDRASCDEARVNELADVLKMIRDVVEGACRRIAECRTDARDGPGRPPVQSSPLPSPDPSSNSLLTPETRSSLTLRRPSSKKMYAFFTIER